jgi:putative ABC transport system permease protein
MRATTRRHEMAVRIALGADRTRLVRQLLTESILLSCLGGTIGIALAVAGVRALVAMAPAGLLPRTNEVHVDGFVLAFTATLCLLTGICFGLVPALQTSKRNLSASIGEGGRAVSGRRSVLRGALVTAEVALALVLLAGAGLVARSFAHLRSVELGFQPEHVLSMTVDLSPTKYATQPAIQGFRDDAVSRLAHLPGVSSAAAVNWRPLGGALIKGTFVLDDGRHPSNGAGWASKPAVTPDYFRVMGIRLLEGRAFTDGDGASAPGVVIVSATIVKRLWPGQSAVGRRISMEDHPKPTDWLTIVGVVDDVIQEGLKSDRDAAVYQPLAQLTGPFSLTHLNFLVRTSGEPSAIAASMRDAMRALDSDQPIESLGTMTSLISSTIAEPLFHVRLLTLVSACALLLAAIGIYGVLAYLVTERTREIGIRVAIGAVPRDVVWMVVRRTLALAVPGVLIGLMASFGLTRVLSGLLFQVQPTDPGTFIGVGVVLLVVALAASIVPARRATHVDPLIALRHE